MLKSAGIRRNEVIEVNKDDARVVYADIIDLPHHQSEKRPHMSLYDRAAQFSPFAALTGYDDMVREEARLTDDMRELSEMEQDNLDQKLFLLSKAIEDRDYPGVTITYFIPDERKSGGRYDRVSGIIKKIDPVERRIVLFAGNMISDGRTIDMERISNIEGDLLSGIE